MNTSRTLPVVFSLPLMVCVAAVAQTTDTPSESAQFRSQKALAEHYERVKSYAMKYAKTPAPASDVAEAALSACANTAKALYSANLSFVRSTDTAEHLQSVSTDAARRWAIQSLLEARFPTK